MQANIKTGNGKNLKVKALVDSGCTHTGIDKQLVKEKKIQTKAINFSFEVFNTDGTKNGEVTKVAPLEVEINEHKETLEAAVMDLAGTDMFLGHDWLVKHNPEVNWKNGTIKFTRCPGNCIMTHKDIQFNARRTKETVKTEQDNGEIARNWTQRTQKIYLSTFDLSHICSTKRNSKSYLKGTNGITKST